MKHARHSLRLLLVLVILLPACVFAQQANADNSDQIEQFALELITTKSEVERNLLLAARKELVTPNLRKELVKHGNNVLAAGQYASALSIYSMVEDISKRIEDKEGSATASLNIGTVNYFQGKYTAAIEQYGRARELFINSGNKTEAAKALFGLGLAHQENHNLTAALEAFERALIEFRAVNDKDEIANALAAIGSVQYSRGEYSAAAKAFLESGTTAENLLHIADAFYMQGNYAQAVDYYEKSLTGSGGSSGAYAAAVGGAANSYYYQGNYERALDYYQKALAVNESLGDPSGAATQLRGMGNTYRAIGDYGAALEKYFKSLELAEKSTVRLSTGGTLGSIGIVRAMQGDNARAIEYFQKSIAEYETTGDKVGMSRMLSHIGNVLFVQGQFDEALDSYRKSLELREAMGDKNNSAHNLSGIGTTYLALGDEVKALENYEKALDLYKSINNRAGTAELLTKISDAELARGDFERALNLSREAIALARENENTGLLWYALTQSGNLERLLNRPVDARKSFEGAISVVESLRSEPTRGEAGTEKSAVLPYLKLLELEIDQDRAAEAFQLAERAKVILLKEAIDRSRTKNSKGLSPAEQETETALTNKLMSLNIQLEREEEKGKSSEVLSMLRDQRRAMQANYQALIRKMYAAHPVLKVNRGDLVPLGFDEAGRLLGDEANALVEFAVAGPNTYLFVLTSQKAPAKTKLRSEGPSLVLKAYPLNITSRDLSTRVRAFNQAIIKHEDLSEQAGGLYELLLKPAAEQLNGKTSLTIVPDGVLWNLPFEALQPAENRYLIEERSIAYEPSFTVLREVRRRIETKRSARLGSSVVFTGPVLTKPMRQRLELAYGNEKTESLTNEPVKVKGLDSRSVSVFAGEAASEDRLKSELSKHRMVGVVAPVIFDDTSPMYSGILLSPGASDGLLNLGELMSLRSEARVAIVSASNVVGRQSGYGNATLANFWTWFVSGTPTLILSRWRVESGRDEELMIELLRKLQAKPNGAIPAASGLRSSVLEFMRADRNRDPYHWSRFMVLGEAR
jgi:tetratricopeptide (TPR) repeat protein